jgi:hypothetical protein
MSYQIKMRYPPFQIEEDRIEDKIDKYLGYVDEGIVSRLALVGAAEIPGLIVRKIQQRKYNKQRIEDLEYDRKMLRNQVNDTDDENIKLSLRRRISSINIRISQLQTR